MSTFWSCRFLYPLHLYLSIPFKHINFFLSRLRPPAFLKDSRNETPKRPSTFTIFFQSKISRLLQATYSWTIVRGYRRKEYIVFFADFLDCNSAPGMDDLLFVFWFSDFFLSFPSSVISVYSLLFQRFVDHLYVYARFVTTFLYLFLFFFFSLNFSYSLNLYDSIYYSCLYRFMKVVSLYQVDSERL